MNLIIDYLNITGRIHLIESMLSEITSSPQTVNYDDPDYIRSVETIYSKVKILHKEIFRENEMEVYCYPNDSY
jgi:hypothetical protein